MLSCYTHSSPAFMHMHCLASVALARQQKCPALSGALQLHPDKQKAIAEELDRNPGEVLKKIEDIRNKIL